MSDQHFILTYLQACSSGSLPYSECGPVWHFAAIAVCLVLAVMLLIALRLRPMAQAR
jgi:type VI protein secretion system component VasF